MKSKAFYGVVNAKRVCIEGTYGKRHWGRMSGRDKKRINLFGLILLVLFKMHHEIANHKIDYPHED